MNLDVAKRFAALVPPCSVSKEDRDLAISYVGRQELPEIDDVNRRELLRLKTLTSSSASSKRNNRSYTTGARILTPSHLSAVHTVLSCR